MGCRASKRGHFMIDKKMFFLKGAAALVWMMGIASIFGGGFAGAQPIQSIPVGTEAVVKLSASSNSEHYRNSSFFG